MQRARAFSVPYRQPGAAAEERHDTARQAAEDSAELGRTFVDLIGEQTRHNMVAATAFGRAVDWADLAQAQREFISGSFERWSQLNDRYRENLPGRNEVHGVHPQALDVRCASSALSLNHWKGPDVTDRLKHDREVIPVVEEQPVILKRKKLTGGIRVRTVVREDEKVIDEPLASEEVEVVRVLLDRWVEAPIPVRQEGETTIITLLEEVAVVEKRLRATEEVRITKRQSVRQSAQHVTLRHEEAVVERLDAAGRGDDDPE